MGIRYFPSYWRQTRSYARGLADAMQAAARQGGVPSAERVLFERVLGAASVAYKVTEESIGRLAQEAYGAQTLSQWELEGRRTVELAPALVEALRHSDCGELTLDDVLPEIPLATYFHFGPQLDWLLGGKSPVEGVVALRPAEGNWRVLLVGRRPGAAWTKTDSVEFQMLRFPLLELSSLPFDQAALQAVELDVQDLDSALEKMPEDGAARQSGLSLREQQQNSISMYVQVLQLLAGAAAYSRYYPDDAVIDWQPDTPAKWVLKAEGESKEAQRARSKLESQGYQRVRLLGRAFEKDESTGSTSRTLRAHWRRGHWRSQAHGPQMSLRKLIWIRPVRVLGGQA